MTSKIENTSVTAGFGNADYDRMNEPHAQRSKRASNKVRAGVSYEQLSEQIDTLGATALEWKERAMAAERALKRLLIVCDQTHPDHDVVLEIEAEAAAAQERQPSYERLQEEAFAAARAALAKAGA